MIAGRDAHICGECVLTCLDALLDPEQAPVPTPDGPPLVLIRVPDGGVHACKQETEWAEFFEYGQPFEWCVTRGMVRGSEPLHVVAVRRSSEAGPSVGQAYPLDAAISLDHARGLARSIISGAGK